MNTFARTKGMHQYYRDVFTRSIYLPEADVLPAHIVTEILNYGNSDSSSLEEALLYAETDLEPDQDKALKLLMVAVVMANAVFDFKSQGQQVVLIDEDITKITNNIVEALQLSDNINYLVAGIQILYRINEISSAMFLISNNLSTLNETPAVLKMLLLTCLMQEDYNQAYVVIQQLTANPELIGDDPLTLVMVVCAIYKLGGYPDSFIDFRPLNDKSYQLDNSRYDWIIAPPKNNKTTVLVACDKGYYYEHAVPLLLSIYETNQDALNVHFHVYHCDSEIEQHFRKLCERLPGIAVSLSSEKFSAQNGMNVHYASRRFVFLRHALDVFSGPMMVLDADCLVRKSWEQMQIQLEGREIIITGSKLLPFWEQIPASFVYTSGGEVALKYFDAAARFIDFNLRNNNAEWFLDQIALTASVDVLSPVEQLSMGQENTDMLVDLRHSTESFSWVVTTQKNAEGQYLDYKNQLKDKYLAAVC